MSRPGEHDVFADLEDETRRERWIRRLKGVGWIVLILIGAAVLLIWWAVDSKGLATLLSPIVVIFGVWGFLHEILVQPARKHQRELLRHLNRLADKQRDVDRRLANIERIVDQRLPPP